MRWGFMDWFFVTKLRLVKNLPGRECQTIPSCSELFRIVRNLYGFCKFFNYGLDAAEIRLRYG